LDGRIPEEEWIGKKVNYSFLKTFDCEAFVHIDKENRTKLEAKSKKCTFIGYGCYNPKLHHTCLPGIRPTYIPSLPKTTEQLF
jgi:hypothetical protein